MHPKAWNRIRKSHKHPQKAWSRIRVRQDKEAEFIHSQRKKKRRRKNPDQPTPHRPPLYSRTHSRMHAFASPPRHQTQTLDYLKNNCFWSWKSMKYQKDISRQSQTTHVVTMDHRSTHNLPRSSTQHLSTIFTPLHQKIKPPTGPLNHRIAFSTIRIDLLRYILVTFATSHWMRSRSKLVAW
jgi:hypothetical protein